MRDNHHTTNSGVWYQLLPEFFYDADGDGRGDLTGAAQKADYLAALGVDGVWLRGETDDPAGLAALERALSERGLALLREPPAPLAPPLVTLCRRENWEAVPQNQAAFKARLLEQLRESMARYWEGPELPRSVSELGSEGIYWQESAQLLGAVLLTLPGSALLYQGQELGMTNCPFSLEELAEDPEAAAWLATKSAGRRSRAELEAKLGRFSRENARTPMQWTGGTNAGFTVGTPCRRVNPNHRRINAAEQERPGSVLDWYRRLIALRRERAALREGAFLPLLEEHPRLWACRRETAGERVLVLANLAGYAAECDPGLERGALLLANYPDPHRYPGLFRPYEVKIYDEEREP